MWCSINEVNNEKNTGKKSHEKRRGLPNCPAMYQTQSNYVINVFLLLILVTFLRVYDKTRQHRHLA